MNIGILISSLGGSPLIVGLERGFKSLGHNVSYYSPGNDNYDLLLVANQTAHTLAYRYPPFPDTKKPIAFIDTAEYGYWKRLPKYAPDFINSFTEAAMRHDTKVEPEQRALKDFLEGRSFPYFLREKHKLFQYPDSYFPIDYPLYAGSDCQRPPNREQYLRRNADLFCAWGASHPWRLLLTDKLRAISFQKGLKSFIEVIEQNGFTRLPQFGVEGYFYLMEEAKATVSYDGYGSGSFRMTEALVRTLLLQGPLWIETRAELIDGETCRTYTVDNVDETFVGTNIADVLVTALEDAEGSFEIYERGYEHCREKLSETATARYVLDVVEGFDYSKPTPLELDVYVSHSVGAANLSPSEYAWLLRPEFPVAYDAPPSNFKR